MKKMLAFCLLLSLLAAACAAPAGNSSSAAPPESSGPAPSQSQTEPPPADYAPNKALEAAGLLGSVDDEVLAAVRIYYYEPAPQELAATVESYLHQEWGAYLYILPRYAGSELTIESMVFDEARSAFLPDRELFASTAGEDYALLLRADLPEGGPQLRVTIRYDGQEAIYEPTYDGRGDIVYPFKKGRVLLDEAPLRARFTDGAKKPPPPCWA